MVGIKRLIQEARNLEPTGPVEPIATSNVQPAVVSLIPTAGSEQLSNTLCHPETDQGLMETKPTDVKEETGENNAGASMEGGLLPNQSESEAICSTDKSEILSGANDSSNQNDTKTVGKSEQNDSKLEDATESAAETITGECQNTS